MKMNFNVILSEETIKFINSLDYKVQKKITYHIQKSREVNDPRLLKKISDDIWEFRTRSGNQQIRLMAFWDLNKVSLIICSHGFVKKSSKVPKSEIEKAMKFRHRYLNKEL